jgi:acyl carrier protein
MLLAKLESSAIQKFIIAKLAELKQLPEEDIDVHCSVFQLGLDSSGALALTGYLEDWLGVLLDPTIFWEYSTISQLADHLGTS